MALNIKADWSQPVDLTLAKSSAIYECSTLEDIPNVPGVYVFCRKFGDNVVPLYVGKAKRLRSRIEQQLNSVKLMTQIKEYQSGARILLYCVPKLKRNQKAEKVIDILERALIDHALSEDNQLLQTKGTKIPNHTVHFTGNAYSQRLVRRDMRVRVS